MSHAQSSLTLQPRYTTRKKEFDISSLHKLKRVINVSEISANAVKDRQQLIATCPKSLPLLKADLIEIKLGSSNAKPYCI